MMTKRLKKDLALIAKISVVGAVMGIVVGHIRSVELEPRLYWYSILKGVLTGGTISFTVSTFEQMLYSKSLRRFGLLPALLIKSATYSAAAIFFFFGISVFFSNVISYSLQMEMLFPAVAITFMAVFVGSAVISVNRLLGKGILGKFIMGRYHNPVEEDRIFMFLDLTGSTTIAEKIGHIRFHKFLNDFVFDVTDPIIDSRGEIHKYVGDEVIADWILGSGKDNFNCLSCFFEIRKKISEKKEKYIKEYGFAPEFKAGLHCGRVVSGEMGDYKKEIAYLGDVVNTSARIQVEAKRLNRDILVSGELLRRVKLPEGIETENMGVVKLKGKENEVELFAVEFGKSQLL